MDIIKDDKGFDVILKENGVIVRSFYVQVDTKEEVEAMLQDTESALYQFMVGGISE